MNTTPPWFIPVSGASSISASQQGHKEAEFDFIIFISYIGSRSKMTRIENMPAMLRKEGIENKILELCEKNDVAFMAIFGSHVRGEQKRRSDLDIAIEYEKGKRKSLFDLVDLEDELSRIFGKNVDLGIFHNLDSNIIGQVKKEMKIIYEKR
jgi:predicted nucleotidyltransferase